MTEFERTPEGKIKLPESKPSPEQVARRQAVEQTRTALEAEQKRVVYERPFDQFKYRLPLDYWQNFTPDELSEIQQAEEVAFNTHRPAAMERDNARRAWRAAGGDDESFNRRYSEEDAIASRAQRIMEQGASSAY